MTQKTLNKIAKYCKVENLRFGQLIQIVMQMHNTQVNWPLDLFQIQDRDFEKAFLEFYKMHPPKKDRGGYYPHGHKKD